MNPIASAVLATAFALAGCASAPPTERVARDAPVVGVAAAQAPGTPATLSSGLNAATADRAIAPPTKAEPGTR